MVKTFSRRRGQLHTGLASFSGQTVTMVTKMKRNKLTAHRNSVITYYEDDELVSMAKRYCNNPKYCRFGNFRVTFISRIFHFRIIHNFLNSRALFE